MKTPSYLCEPQIKYLYQLLDEIQNGTLFVPKFQRCLVWNNKQRLELLLSIKEEMPIGSIIVWRTSQHSLATLDKLGGVPLPKSTAAHSSYLLDGHQRLSTLFSALEGTGDENGNFFYDLEEDDFVLQGSRKKQIWMPVNVLLDSLALLKFQRTLKDKKLIEKTNKLSNTFRNYKMVVVPIAYDDLKYATTVFRRINSNGMSMIEGIRSPRFILAEPVPR